MEYRGAAIRWCISMRYSVIMIRIDTAYPVYRESYDTICTDILEKGESNKTHTFFWSDLWKYSDINLQSHVLLQPATIVVVGTPSTGVA